jgi:hypothetical protein
MIHIPAAEIGQLLIKLSKNPSFLHVGRILMISLVALSAIGCAGIWVEGSEPWMPGCTIPKWGCYVGPPLSLLEYIDQLGATKYLLLLPIIDFLSAIILLFQPRRTYLMLLLMSFVAFFLPMLGGDPHPYTNVASGDGYWLHIIAAMLMFLLSFSLAIAEQSGAINKKTSWEQDWGLKD